MEDPSSGSEDQAMMEEDDGGEEVEGGGEVPSFVFKANHEAKLRELLHKINSNEIKLCSDATKEFSKLLKGNAGAELLHVYVHTSSNFSELLGAWKLQQGKPGMPYILSLISAILSHPDGKYMPNDKERVSISRVLDKFARSLIEEKLEFVHKELSCKEGKRQKAALLLISSIVRRGSGLASEVAKNFNFKLQGFSKLSAYELKQNDKKRKHSTRKAFIGFAMSFLEVGKPGLLRWVLQQKEMYSGVLRGLGNDDDETVTYVLSTLRGRVLTKQSLVSPGLRSVLFGRLTLEQLVAISARENGGAAAELAHNMLLMVCTDPCNGLMPDLKGHPNRLRGNPKRLLGLMKKLKATEIGYHRELLLAIVRGRPSFGSAYLEEFPYNLEDYKSPTWFASVSLAANLVSSVDDGLPFGFLESYLDDPPSFDSADVQSIMNCISSRAFSRSVINKGLLHSDFLVKNGTLRLLLEALKLLDSFFRSINFSFSRKQRMQRWKSLKQEIQNEIQTLLPDPQVLLTLLSSLSSHTKTDEASLKRAADKVNFPEHGGKRIKKLKTDIMDEDMDIIVAGVNSAPDIASHGDTEHVVDAKVPDELDSIKDFMNMVSELWGSDLCSVPVSTLKNVEIFFHSKLLSALKIYFQTMPTALEGSFEFFMSLLSNPLALPTNLQCSLLSLLLEYIRWSPTSGFAIKTPPLMYKHLQPFINLLIFSPIAEIKGQAYSLAQAAMSSTGAFDRNLHEIVAWFLFLPGYRMVKSSVKVQGVEVLQSLSPVVISFLCDAISTVGNNLFRYWDVLWNHVYHLKEFKDVSPNFSPLIICILQKCLRLLNSESRTFSLPDKSTISVYVCNTLKYLLQTQVDAGLFSALIRSVLSEGFQNHHSLVDGSEGFCEWRPLKNLLLFAESILSQQACCFFTFDQKARLVDDSFAMTLGEVRKIVGSGHGGDVAGITNAFYSSIMCTTSDVLLKNFPSLMTISQCLQVPDSFLLSLIFLELSFLAGVLKLWPKVFSSGLEMAVSMINPEDKEDEAFAEVKMANVDFDVSESAAAAAFGLFLRQAPFHVLFPAIISIDVPYLLESSKIKDLLLDKLSELTSDTVISYSRLLLFWLYQLQSSYRIKPVVELEQVAEICYILLKHVLARVLVLDPFSECPTNKFGEVAETIFCHPAVIASLACPLSCNEDFTEGSYGNSLEAFLSFSGQTVHKIDRHVLNTLTTTFDYLLSPSGGQHSILEVEDGSSKQLVKAFNALVQMLYLELRSKFDQCIRTEDSLPLLPPFYALHTLSRFVSPFELLELVQWTFGRVNANNLIGQKPCRVSALSVGLCIAGDAFEILSTYLQQPMTKRALFYIFQEEKIFNVNLIEEIYVEVCKCAAKFELDFAYSCLLKAVNAVYIQKEMQHDTLHPLSLAVSRVVMSTPVEILTHCIYRTSMTKAKLLLRLIDISPLHLSVFGHLFLRILNKDFHFKGKAVEETCGSALSDNDFIMLLPAALSYLNSISMKFEKQYYKKFADIPSFYAKMLLNGFCRWKSFISGYVFQEDYDEFLPSSIEEVVNLVDNSLLGKAIHMLQHHFALSGDMKMKERLKLFNSVLTSSVAHGELLDCNVGEIEFYSLNQSLNLINRVVAKISFCRMLLFPKDNQILSQPKEADGNPNEISLDTVSSKEGQSRMQFLKLLVDAWQCMVTNFPVPDSSRKEKISDCLWLYRYLELFILRTIFELNAEMNDGLIQLQSVPFIEQLMRSSLLYRFEDPTTLKFVCSILTVPSQGKVSCALYLQLLLAHSQFAPTICSVTKSFGSQTGAFVRPMSSILRSLVTFHPNRKNDLQTSELYLKRLEIVKLLRVLLRLKVLQSGRNSGEDIGINLKELHSLLLSSYGATLSDIDLEIYNLMLEIESIDISVSEQVAEMDYLWGSAALKIRKEWAIYEETSNIRTDAEAVEEYRRSQFRENIPVDPKMCVQTVLHFPYNRTVSDGPLSLGMLQPENLKDVHKANISDFENAQCYDPVFLLRFSIHTLSTGYIEPVEFAGLGLLAVAFISMSSPDIGMRKLGYESIGRYKNALERCQKKKDIMQLRLLLTYLQNGIEEPWQRIPSIIALFAAESSFILLDPSHDHYTTLSKHLMRTSRVNMKCIPMFHTLFQSNSINFRAERLLVLRLACAGLNLDDDSQMFIRNSIVETLLSFYSSPLSDIESKELILQIVKKSVKLHKMTCYLVEHCGLFPWLSSVLSIYDGILNENERKKFSQQMVMVIEVATDVVSSRNIIEWLQNDALEQLMELATHLYKLLVGGLIKENVALVNSVLHIMISTLRISQKREIYQPHFTLSFQGLFQIYQAFDICSTAKSSANSDIGLKTILMSTPSADILETNSEKLSSFLLWAVSVAMKSDSQQIFDIKKSHVTFSSISEEDPCKEFLISKLLRWLVASVILGKLSWRLNDASAKFPKRPSSKTLQSFLEYVGKGSGESNKCRFASEEVLAATIFYIQQLSGMNCTELPSVVSALCLLILSDTSKYSDFMLGYGTTVVSLWSKISCPTEANPAWRWSYYQSWRDLSSEMSGSERMDERHACQTLTVIISNILGKKSLDSQVLSHQDVEHSGVFRWERSLLEAD